jgi:hypothetical protein
VKMNGRKACHLCFTTVPLYGCLVVFITTAATAWCRDGGPSGTQHSGAVQGCGNMLQVQGTPKLHAIQSSVLQLFVLQALVRIVCFLCFVVPVLHFLGFVVFVLHLAE